MISAADFKKQISKPLSGQMRELGFKGSGFNYLMDTDKFVFTIGIQASQYGGQCCMEFGIQPKAVDTNGFQKIDFKKLKYYNCEFRARLSPKGQGDYWWKYSDNESENIQVVQIMLTTIKTQVIPIINKFKSTDNFLDAIQAYDLANMYTSMQRLFNGLAFGTTDIRMAWVLAKTFEKDNLPKAKEFAKYGLSKLGNSNKFFAIDELNDIATRNNEA
jgi:hypothetical protein